jgi:hypothetical protein
LWPDEVLRVERVELQPSLERIDGSGSVAGEQPGHAQHQMTQCEAGTEQRCTLGRTMRRANMSASSNSQRSGPKLVGGLRVDQPVVMRDLPAQWRTLPFQDIAHAERMRDLLRIGCAAFEGKARASTDHGGAASSSSTARGRPAITCSSRRTCRTWR